jgi:hypothetical protein
VPTTKGDHDALARAAAEGGFPGPPRRPAAGECCDRDCDPCVWDDYERALSKWCERHGQPRPRQRPIIDVAEL